MDELLLAYFFASPFGKRLFLGNQLLSMKSYNFVSQHMIFFSFWINWTFQSNFSKKIGIAREKSIIFFVDGTSRLGEACILETRIATCVCGRSGSSSLKVTSIRPRFIRSFPPGPKFTLIIWIRCGTFARAARPLPRLSTQMQICGCVSGPWWTTMAV